MNVLACILLAALLPQPESPRDVIRLDRELGPGEVQLILRASREALTGKTFRLASSRGGQGWDVLMGPDGQPKIVRWEDVIEGGVVGGSVGAGGRSTPPARTYWRRRLIRLHEYTGRPARRCDGGASRGELVLEYRLYVGTKKWTTWAAQRTGDLINFPPNPALFQMLHDAAKITTGELRRVNGRLARAFTSPWTPPGRSAIDSTPALIGDPIPNVRGEPFVKNDTVQTLWIDVRSLLPLRWEALHGGARAFVFDFEYSSSTLRLPAGVRPPDCIR